jgi:hypothetical protein
MDFDTDTRNPIIEFHRDYPDKGYLHEDPYALGVVGGAFLGIVTSLSLIVWLVLTIAEKL